MQWAGQGEMLSRTEPARCGSTVGEQEGVTGVVRLSLLKRTHQPRLERPTCELGRHLAERTFGQGEARGVPRGAVGGP